MKFALRMKSALQIKYARAGEYKRRSGELNTTAPSLRELSARLTEGFGFFAGLPISINIHWG